MELLGIYLIVLGVWAIVFLFARADRERGDWKRRDLELQQEQVKHTEGVEAVALVLEEEAREARKAVTGR